MLSDSLVSGWELLPGDINPGTPLPQGKHLLTLQTGWRVCQSQRENLSSIGHWPGVYPPTVLTPEQTSKPAPPSLQTLPARKGKAESPHVD